MTTPEQPQAPLNGASYGPSVPSTQPRYKRRPRNCCILSSFLKVIITIVVALGIAALVFWLVVRPTKIKFYVASADLKQFDLNTNTNTLNYNLDLTMVSRNPNRRVGVYYDMLDATASYKGNRFSWVALPRFYQGHKNTTTLNTNFRGQSVIVNRFDVDTFRREKNNGVFYIKVKIYARMRFKVGAVKTRRTKPEIECDLRIPLAASNGTVNLGRRFETTRCDIDF